MTTVGQLIELLKEYDQDLEVVLAKDGEGNDYSPLCVVEEASCEGRFEKTCTWSYERLDYDEEDADELEEGDDREGQTMVILWPTN